MVNTEYGMKKIKAFTDLDAWKEAHGLVLLIYKQTRLFPKEELFGLTSQMRRCVVSITSNIAEGFGRRSYKEKVNFYYISHGSLIELENQTLIARDVGYISGKEAEDILNKASTVGKILAGLIKSSKSLSISG